jgi:hypothetical protein
MTHGKRDDGRPARRSASLLAALALLAGLVAAGPGCEQRVVQTDFGHESSSGGSGGGSAGGGGDFLGMSNGEDESEASGQTWAIFLGRFEGANHQQKAEQAAQRLAGAADFADVWVAEEDDRSVVYHGRYEGSDSEQARRDLRRWHALHQRGQIEAEGLMLVPVMEGTEGGNPKHDLRSMSGNENAAYTLQIGFYDDRYGENFRRAAEEAVAKLREDGHRAFYYHGPNRSMVTIGVFPEEAVTIGRDGVPQFNQQIQQLQEEFPHNFGNGRKLKVTRDGETYNQPSFPVRIPEGGGSMGESGGSLR